MIVDVIASIGLLVGSLLMVLGSFGLLRFPDVFTRMHAATKAATVGVIGITAAAAAEAGTVGGFLVLGLVVALLFLSGPLGMSLLARAAYHDPETPRTPATRELAAQLPVPETSPTERGAGTSLLLALWLWLVWVAAFGSFEGHVIVGGAVVAGTIAFFLRRLAPRWPQALLHPIATGRFIAHFLGQLTVATWQVTWALRLKPDQLSPAVVEVPLRVHTRNEVTLLMNAISFTPGTVALELHDKMLYVHVLTMDHVQPVLDEIALLEDRIIAVFSSRKEQNTES
jgi:multicomponent Na+:H+ antiporter subunit G